jgi:hypothetical protein
MNIWFREVEESLFSAGDLRTLEDMNPASKILK